MTVLQGARVRLRPIDHGDAGALRRIRTEPEVERWWGPPPGRWPAGETDPVTERLTILVGDEPVGLIQYHEEPDADQRHADIDIFLTGRLHDRGIGTEALVLLADHLLTARGHHRLTLWTTPENARAIRAYEKAGFRRVGVTRLSMRDAASGEWRDELLMERVVPPGEGPEAA